MSYSNENIEQDLLGFLNVLIKEYSKTRNLLPALKKASEGSYRFSEMLETSIARYESGMSAYDSFAKSKCPAPLNETMLAVAAGLENGTDSLHSLKDLRKRLEERLDYKLRTSGAMDNAFSINKLGGMVFFPLFAGVSLDIMKFATTMSGQLQNDSLSRLGVVFGAYILITNYINSRYDKGIQSNRQALAKTALCSMVGIALFVASAAFTISFLGV